MRVILTADGSRTLYCDKYQQAFHSESGAVSEASHVFLINSGVSERLVSGLPTRVCEIGFGVGLNFFLTADCALDNSTPLHYFAVDHRPVEVNLLEDLGYRLLVKHPKLLDEFVTQYRRYVELENGEFEFGIRGLVALRLREQSATEQLPEEIFDCIYLDAFSPASNQELWTTRFLLDLYNRTVNGGVLVTYCVKTEIQRRLKSVGFRIQKIPGPPGGKREVLRAVKD